MKKRLYLSPPHMGGKELDFVREAFASNFIAPVGPQLDKFEEEFAKAIGAKYAVAVTSGTAALHLALRYVGVDRADEVLCSTLTFVATANAVLYLGGKPVFIDSEKRSWNMDPELLAYEMRKRAKKNRLPKAVVLVHIYGQSADIDPIREICESYEVPLIEDAAEALGATYKGASPGTFGMAGIFSFNGNKMITTSGGGMIVSNHKNLIDKVRFWATQARDPAPYYQHSEIGFNYRMSNILAAIGLGQLAVLREHVAKKREIFSFYQKALGDVPGISFMPEAPYGVHSRWLTCVTIEPDEFGAKRDHVLHALAEKDIESRPVWKPMHLQPLFSGCQRVGGAVAEELFYKGLCLPSGITLEHNDLERVVSIIRGCQL